MTNTIIKSFVGGHDVSVFAMKDVTFDSSIRKYRLNKGAAPSVVIPYSGQMLSAKASQSDAESIIFGGVEIPTQTPQVWESVDPVPEDCDLCIVSAMYVAGCKGVGVDTSKLLTMGGTVVDDAGRVIGVVGFNRN